MRRERASSTVMSLSLSSVVMKFNKVGGRWREIDVQFGPSTLPSLQ